jgi:hypothetical protein
MTEPSREAVRAAKEIVEAHSENHEAHDELEGLAAAIIQSAIAAAEERARREERGRCLAAFEKIAEFYEHSDRCQRGRGRSDHRCTCGLDAARRELEGRE